MSKLGQKIENICAQKVHTAVKPVLYGIFPCRIDRELRNIDRCNVRRTALCGIERKRTRVGEAIKHLFALGYLCNGKAVVFLVKEEPRFLPVLYINGVDYAVLGYLGDR